MTLPGSTKSIGRRITGRHALAADAREGVDVELVIGKDHKVLEVLRIRSSIVVEPVEGIVHTGQHGTWRAVVAGQQAAVPLDDRIVNGGEILACRTNRAAAGRELANSLRR